MKRTVLLACTFACCLLLTACGPKVTGFEMTLAKNLPVGETTLAQLNAAYDKPDATDEDKTKAFDALGIAYTSSDEAVATVDASGTVTAVTGGKVTITATAGSLTASKDIEVLVPLTGVDALKTLALVKNKTDSGKLNAKPLPANATVEGLFTYKSSDEKVATVSADGTVTAVANGEVVITTTLDGKSAETKVTITTAATGIGLESTAGWIYVGGGYTLKPFTMPTEAPASTYTFASANTGVATINANGLITGKSVGSAKITIKSADGFETSYTITVNAKPAPPKPKPKPKPVTSTKKPAASGGAAAGGGAAAAPDAGGGGGGGGSAAAPAPAPPAEPQHYHGNGSDWGVCPVCGGSYSPSVGVGGGGGTDLGGWD